MFPMQLTGTRILTIHGGSSSIKFGIYDLRQTLQRCLSGKIDRIGLNGTDLTFNDPTMNRQDRLALNASDYVSPANFLVDWLEAEVAFDSIGGIGHRVVHGMQHVQPVRISQKLMEELHQISPCAPEHLPGEITLIEAFGTRHPQLPQVACFDTAFHRTMTRVA